MVPQMRNRNRARHARDGAASMSRQSEGAVRSRPTGCRTTTGGPPQTSATNDTATAGRAYVVGCERPPAHSACNSGPMLGVDTYLYSTSVRKRHVSPFAGRSVRTDPAPRPD